MLVPMLWSLLLFAFGARRTLSFVFSCQLLWHSIFGGRPGRYGTRLGGFKLALGLLIVGYVVLPVDLIPDFIPLVGFLDDLAVFAMAFGLMSMAVSAFRRENLATHPPVGQDDPAAARMSDQLRRDVQDPQGWPPDLCDVPLPHEFLCPISLQLMRNPVCTVNGHTYDEVWLRNLLRHKQTEPMTGLPLRSQVLIPDEELKGRIHAFVAAHTVQGVS